MVINVDGTMSRIANWAEMAEIERRNKERLEVLRGKEGGGGKGGSER